MLTYSFDNLIHLQEGIEDNFSLDVRSFLVKFTSIFPDIYLHIILVKL